MIFMPHARRFPSAPSDLGSYQKKVFKIDDHMGIAVSGLIADARLLGPRRAFPHLQPDPHPKPDRAAPVCARPLLVFFCRRGALTSRTPPPAKYMRNECLNHTWAYESSMQVGRLTAMVSDKAQVYTQKQEKRPYGVGPSPWL